jgi:hypothetical protein
MRGLEQPGAGDERREPGSVFLRLTRAGEPPLLMPIDELSSGPGADGGGGPERPRATARTRREAKQAGPSLPFSGFSVLALLVTGLAATSAGGRLRLVAEPPRPEPAADDYPEEPAALRPPAPSPAAVRPGRRPLYVAIAALGIAGVAVAAARRR